ncbi:hypothetical protein HDU97_008075 [Phlyctochytrium planicorne]|nr:hypothetical protein HDU97_008075 [Phlyctochytrium planicorne]
MGVKPVKKVSQQVVHKYDPYNATLNQLQTEIGHLRTKLSINQSEGGSVPPSLHRSASFQAQHDSHTGRKSSVTPHRQSVSIQPENSMVIEIQGAIESLFTEQLEAREKIVAAEEALANIDEKMRRRELKGKSKDVERLKTEKQQYEAEKDQLTRVVEELEERIWGVQQQRERELDVASSQLRLLDDIVRLQRDIIDRSGHAVPDVLQTMYAELSTSHTKKEVLALEDRNQRMGFDRLRSLNERIKGWGGGAASSGGSNGGSGPGTAVKGRQRRATVSGIPMSLQTSHSFVDYPSQDIPVAPKNTLEVPRVQVDDTDGNQKPKKKKHHHHGHHHHRRTKMENLTEEAEADGPYSKEEADDGSQSQSEVPIAMSQEPPLRRKKRTAEPPPPTSSNETLSNPKGPPPEILAEKEKQKASRREARGDREDNARQQQSSVQSQIEHNNETPVAASRRRANKAFQAISSEENGSFNISEEPPATKPIPQHRKATAKYKTSDDEISQQSMGDVMRRKQSSKATTIKEAREEIQREIRQARDERLAKKRDLERDRDSEPPPLTTNQQKKATYSTTATTSIALAATAAFTSEIGQTKGAGGCEAPTTNGKDD